MRKKLLDNLVKVFLKKYGCIEDADCGIGGLYGQSVSRYDSEVLNGFT